MSVIDPAATTAVELSRAEQWVVHHVVLDSLGLADGQTGRTADGNEDVRCGLDVIEKVESGSFVFTPTELAFIQEACGTHARTTEATADRNLASAVADRVDVVFRDSTA